MAEKIGKLVICDLCGCSEFIAHTKTTDHDGGYTKVDHYETLSEGWQYSHDLGVKLCPTCGAAWEATKTKFRSLYGVEVQDA